MSAFDKYNLYERNLYKFLSNCIFGNYRKSYVLNGIIDLYIKANRHIFHNVYLNYIEVPITTKCSLRCKECANLIQYYDKGKFFDYREIVNDVHKLCQCVKGINQLRILGGEPLMHPNLKEILLGILKNENIENIQIVTNGTMLFEEDVLNILRKERKCSVDISNYGKVSRNYDKLRKQLRNYGIKYCSDKDLQWTPQGDISYRNRSEKELEEILRVCRSDCVNMLDGDIHLCPRSSSGHDLEILKADKTDHINLRSYKSKRQFKEDLFYLLNKKSIVACNYCDYYMRDVLKTCIPGEQIAREEALEKYIAIVGTRD
ncbi:MAG: radical SAM protein [Lachnospiraceae bacterium]|nr:radical SAM protein [Lachnospiraceae bacterium]